MDYSCVVGIEKNEYLKSPFYVLYGDNRKIIRTIDIDQFSVIDIDAYGSPFEIMEYVFETAKNPKVIIYTFNRMCIAGINKEINVWKLATERCKTILNPYADDMFSYYLYKHGVKQYYEIRFEAAMKKRYGYFIYNPKTY